MKELTTAEKAKRYDEALEIARQFSEHPLQEDSDSIIEYIFPELKESEDERIRKGIIYGLKYLERELSWDALGDIDILDAYSWLEKQGGITELSEEEQNRFAKGVLTSCALSFIDYLDAHKYEGKMCVSNGECEDIENAFHNAMWDRLHRYYCKYIEKQGEQKPTDKVEPKFHEGEWITNGDYTWKIVEVKPLDYVLKSQDGNIVDDTISHVDEQFRSFTIEDAKDGDVLVNQNGEMPFIFKECKGNHIYCYCGYTNRKDIFFDRFVNIKGEELHWVNLYYEQVYPATKEQRDLLFQKMHEAGYMWDSESKQLLSLKAKPSGKQKTAWSEEDEERIKNILSVLDVQVCWDGATGKKGNPYQKEIDWLKSLKQRIGG